MTLIGPWGRMAEIATPAPLPVSTGRPDTFQTALSGRRYATRASVSRRQWEWDLVGLDDIGAAKVEQLLHDARRGPLWWMDPTAPSSNMILAGEADPVPSRTLTAVGGGGAVPSYVALDGTSGTYIGGPAPTSFDDGLDVRWFGVPSLDSRGMLAGQWAGGKSWRLDITEDGRIFLILHSDDGGRSVAPTHPDADGATLIGVRVTWDRTSGQAVWYSADDPDDPVETEWTQFDEHTLSAAGIMPTPGGPIEVGGYAEGAALLVSGSVSYVQVRDGPDGPVRAGVDFTGVTDDGKTTFGDSVSGTWTLGGAAALVVTPDAAEVDGRVWDMVSGVQSSQVPTVSGVEYRVDVRASDTSRVTVRTLDGDGDVVSTAGTHIGTGKVSVSWTAGTEAGVLVSVSGDGWGGVQMVDTSRDPEGWRPGRGCPKVHLSGLDQQLLWALKSGDVRWRDTSVTLTEVDG